jgi:hypothetical protein
MAKRFLGFLLLGLMCMTPAFGQDIPDTPDPDDVILPEPGQDIPRERRAQTGFKFLSVSPDARAAGMGDAYTAMKLASTAMFYNPASMAYFDRKIHVAAGQIKWIADIDYNMGSVAFSTNWGVFGLSMVSVDYGDFERTVRADTELGFLDVGTYSPSAWAFGLGYAKAITDLFSVGGNVRIAKQSLGAGPISLQGTTPVTKDFSEKSTIVDFGVLYWTGYKSLTIALNTRNFSSEKQYSEESFELPLTFRMGLAMDFADFTSLDKEAHSILVSIDTERPRDFSEVVKIGVDYTIMKTLSLRAGYVTPSDEQGISLGVGFGRDLGSMDLRVDYAYTDFGVFDKVNRLTIQAGF